MESILVLLGALGAGVLAAVLIGWLVDRGIASGRLRLGGGGSMATGPFTQVLEPGSRHLEEEQDRLAVTVTQPESGAPELPGGYTVTLYRPERPEPTAQPGTNLGA